MLEKFLNASGQSTGTLVLLGWLWGRCHTSKAWISFASENSVLAQNVTLFSEPEIEDGGEFDHGTGLYAPVRVWSVVSAQNIKNSNDEFFCVLGSVFLRKTSLRAKMLARKTAPKSRIPESSSTETFFVTSAHHWSSTSTQRTYCECGNPSRYAWISFPTFHNFGEPKKREFVHGKIRISRK